MGPKELADYYGRIRKKGQATLKLIFRPAPGDETFEKHQPIANVTVQSYDPVSGTESHQTFQMSERAKEHEVTIPVLNILGVAKSWWYKIRRKERPKPFKVTITLAPLPPWEEDYVSSEFPVEVELGSNLPQAAHVWLSRRKSIWNSSHQDKKTSTGTHVKKT